MAIKMESTAGLRKRLADMSRRAELKTHDALLAATEVALAVARGKAPGKLPSTITARPLNQYAIRVSSSSKVAIFHEVGARAHWIRPVNGKVLAFQVAGATVFARGVYHPGAKALHFMAQGREAGRVVLRKLLHDILK